MHSFHAGKVERVLPSFVRIVLYPRTQSMDTGNPRSILLDGNLCLLIGLVRIQYCTPSRRPLPNMGEKERGLPDTPSSETSSFVTATPVAARQPQTPTPKATLAVQPPVLIPKTVGVIRPRKGRAVSTTGAGDGSRGWASNWREVVWEKWRWGVLIALAVIVSRITTSA